MSPAEPSPLEAIVRRIAAQGPPERAIEAVYQAAFSGLWQQLVPLVGALGARAIFSRAIQVVARQQPAARTVSLTDDGPQLGTPGDPAALAAYGAVARGLHDALLGLIGPGLLGQLLRDVEHDVERWAVSEFGTPAEHQHDDRPLPGEGEADDEQ